MGVMTPLVDRFASYMGSEPLDSLPHRYVVAARGEYAHRARCASTKEMGRRGITVGTLCGQLLHDPILTDDPVGPMCGTCYGRQLGIDTESFAFRPRTWFSLPKRWCNSLGYVELDNRQGRCLSCGWVGGTWCSGGPWGGSVSMRKHEHGGRGVVCPDHGRRHLYEFNSTVVCGAHRCEHRPIESFPSE